MARKKEESTNEKIVRLYKEGHSADFISRTMAIPKGNIIGILEKYFPDYQTYVQPKVDEPAESEEKEKGKKLSFNMNVGDMFKRGKKDKAEEPVDPDKVSINLDMDENGFVDRTVAGIAQMLKKGRSVADVAEFFNREKSEIKAVEEVMAEHFKRQETPAAPRAEQEKTEEPAAEEKHSFTRTSVLATGLESEKEKPAKPKYTPPTYTKRDDPKPVSASYGLASDTPADSVSLLDREEPTKTIDLLHQPEPTKNIDLLHQPEPTKNIDLVAESAAGKNENEVKLVPDSTDTAAKPKKSVSLMDDIPEMPSIDPISLDDLDRELSKTASNPAKDIPKMPDIGYNNTSASADNLKEENSGMSPMEKMKQFAQEQIALNNQKIEELKNKKVDAENNAFDCNTKVEAMKKQIEDMQAQLLVLIDEKNKAGEIVSGINEEIESINQENVEFGAYL